MKKIIITILSILMITSCVLTLGACSCGNNEEPSHTTHEYGAWQYDNDKHWKQCECGEKSQEGNHNWNGGAVTTPATTESDGVKTFTCNDCGKTKTEKIDKLPEDHSHTYGNWQYDNDYHWHECACGDKADKAGHEWGTGEVTTAPQVGVDGVRTFTCSVCEKTKTELIAALVQLNHVAETYEIDMDSVVFDWKGNDLNVYKMTLTGDQSAIESALTSNNFAANECFIILDDSQVERSGKGTFVYDVDANGKINLYTSLENYENKSAVSNFSAQFNPVRDKITFIVSLGEGGSTISATYNMIKKTSVMLAVPTISFEYDGMEKVSIEIDEESPYKVEVGTVSATNVGNYSVTIALKDKKNTKWSDGTLLSKTFTWEITQAQGSIAFNDGVDLTKTYDGAIMNNIEEHQYTKTGDGNVVVEWYKGENKLESVPVDAGEYKVKLILEETANYTGATAEKTFTINKRKLNINITKTYDGNDDLTVGVISYPLSNYKILEMDESLVNVSIVPGSKYSTADAHDNESLSLSNVIALSGEKANNYRAYSIKGYINKADGNIDISASYVGVKYYDGNPATNPTAADYTKLGDGNVRFEWFKINDDNDEEITKLDGAPTEPAGAGYTYYLDFIAEECTNYKKAVSSVPYVIHKPDVQFSIVDFIDAAGTKVVVGEFARGTISVGDTLLLIVGNKMIGECTISSITVDNNGIKTNPESVNAETQGTIAFIVETELNLNEKVDKQQNPLLVRFD